jgi:hypothetical protein
LKQEAARLRSAFERFGVTPGVAAVDEIVRRVAESAISIRRIIAVDCWLMPAPVPLPAQGVPAVAVLARYLAMSSGGACNGLNHAPSRTLEMKSAGGVRGVLGRGQTGEHGVTSFSQAAARCSSRPLSPATGRHLRYTASREPLVAGLRELHLELLLPLEQHSRVLTAVLEPGHPNYSFTAMHEHVYAREFTIYPGKFASLGMFRLANLRAIDRTEIVAFPEVWRTYLDHSGIL